MYNVKDFAKLTGLKEPFVRRCIRELKDVFEPHIERGAKNSLVLGSSIIPIFDKIKQDKANGLSLPAIKNLLSSDVLVSKQVEKDLDKKLSSTASYQSDDTGGWLDLKEAAKLSKRSESTIKRVIISGFKHDHSCLKKDESSKRGKWLINKKFLLDHFNIKTAHKPGHDPVHNPDRDIDYNRDHDGSNIGRYIVHNQGQLVSNQVVELLEKQIEVLQEQLQNQTDDFKIQTVELKEQLSKQADDFKDQLNQKDQQIHQLHVLLKESKTSTIDYKPDDKVGVFSKVLMRFGL